MEVSSIQNILTPTDLPNILKVLEGWAHIGGAIDMSCFRYLVFSLPPSV